MKRSVDSTGALAGLGLLVLVAGCGGRPLEYDAAFSPSLNGEPRIEGLTGSVAVLDPSLNELMMLTSPRPLDLSVARLPVGLDVVKFVPSPSREQLFVLSRGVQPRFNADDEKPQLRVFDGSASPSELAKYELQDPYERLEVDPLGEWLIIHGGEGLVSNPNELILVRLGEKTTTTKTLDSNGGKPIRFTFTGAMSAPGAEARRLLVVQREQDLAIIDLADLDAPEITVGLPERVGGGFASPDEVVFHDGVEGEVGPMLAVRLAGDPSVYLLSLGESKSAEHAFSLAANLVDVGGVPSTIDFVQTQQAGGLRLAALVPSKKAAMLVEPASGRVQAVELPQGFDKIKRITDDVTESTGEDIALLYGQGNTIAFWRLGTTTGTPYRSIDSYPIGISIDTVLDIPGEEFADTKILANTTASTKQFYVLNLRERTSLPLDLLKNLTLNVSPDGQRLWAFDAGFNSFAQLRFDPLQPSSLSTQRPISYVHDVQTRLSPDMRSVMALHLLPSGSGSSLAATLFDGVQPETAGTRFFSALELGGVQ